jgi:lysophospholipase L1-like esterase
MMKRHLVCCFLFTACSLAVSGVAQGTSAPAPTTATEPAAHSNLHPPQEDWARLALYAADNARLSAEVNPKPRVVFLGDSITFHWQDVKHTSFFPDHPNFVERGIAGNNAAQMLLRYRSDVLALHPKVVVLLAGTNDLAAFKLPDVVGFTEQSISSIVEIAQVNHEHIILCSVLPITDAIRPQTTERHPEDILRLNSWLRNYAAEKHIPYVNFYSTLSDGHDRMRTELTVDGLHPNGDGYKLMEPLLLPKIEKELARK